jgi:hypothetical protein
MKNISLLLLLVTGGIFFPEVSITSESEIIVAEANLIAVPCAVSTGGIFFVVWQEGWPGINGSADILGRRVEAGTLKLLDTTPVRVCVAPEAQSYPAVACGDGVFLVVWQDMRNGRDYDIRGTIVEVQTGKVIVSDFPVAERPHNQAKPSVAWTGKHFLVVWQEVSGRDVYGIMGVRVLSTGKVIDSQPFVYSTIGANPRVCVSGDKAVVVWADGQTVSGCMVDPGEGKVIGSAGKKGKINTRCPNDIDIAGDGKGNFMVVSARESFPNPWGWPGPGAVLCSRINADGSAPEESVDYGYYLNNVCGRKVSNVVDTATWGKSERWLAGAPGGFKGTADGMWPYGDPAVAWDGKGSFIFAWVKGKILPDRLTLSNYEIWVRGMDSKTLAVTMQDNRIAGGDGSDALSPVLVTVGPDEMILVYLKKTGEKMKIVARKLR